MARKPPRKPASPQGLPSADDIVEFVRSAGAKVGKREIARAFGITGAGRLELKKLLRELKEQGRIEGGRRDMSDASQLPPVAVLQVKGLDDDGELIAEPLTWDTEERGTAPLVLMASQQRQSRRADMQPPAPGNRILARLRHTGGEPYAYEGKLIRRLDDQRGRMLGQFRRDAGGHGRIIAIDKKARSELAVLPGADKKAKAGELVAYEPVRDRGRGLVSARIVERLGDASDPRNISMIAIHQHGIPNKFPERVLAAAEALQPFSKPGKRIDLREVDLVTIDPPDARDHDDAVWAGADDDPANKGGCKVIVAIADVAFYVHPGGTLDDEALLRGNSVYFPDRVVPMLPERISNDLCSLREGEVRPAMACQMTFDKSGRKISHRFERAVMRSPASLTYEQAQAAIDGRPDDKTGPLLTPVLKPLWAAYRILAKGRAARKPLELDLPERKLILDAHGIVERVVTPLRLDAHRLVEEFMIQANVCAAETLEARRAPLIYRVHDAPSREKIAALAEFLRTVGLSVAKGQVMKPQHFNAILAKAANKDYQHVVNEVVLRTQSQAIYDTANLGHFGLNLRRYAHFTSPIRRYADLIVHRALITALGLGKDGLSERDIANMSATAEQISGAERRAMAAERNTVDRLIAAHLASEVGNRFAARISGVTRAGLFVALDDSGADGFVPAASLEGEYFVHDESRHALVGERSGRTYQLGDRVEVQLREVTPIAGGLRFEMLSAGREGKPLARRHAGRRGGRKPARRR